MKKLVIFIFLFIILMVAFPTTGVSHQSVSGANEVQVIPDEAIRLRILANSDQEADQHIKRLVRDEVSGQISNWVEHISDIDEARRVIRTQIPIIKSTVEKVLEKNNKASQALEVTYGSNVTFPVKLYDTFLYPAGEYEAVLITIGEGKGANWWCVLFPPLCFLDFSNGSVVGDADEPDEVEDAKVAETEDEEEPVKVKFFLFEWFGWT